MNFETLVFNNQFYQTDLTGGNLQPFGAPLRIGSGSVGESYVSSSPMIF